MVFKILFGAKTSRYGPYELGYRRATKNFYNMTQNLTLKFIILNLYIFINYKKKYKKWQRKEELIIKESYNIKL
jgi:hypothetical protein